MASGRGDPLEAEIPAALAEAKRRWGEDGHVFLEDCPPSPPTARCLVGVASCHLLTVHGAGPTWADAFEDADKQKRVLFIRKLPPFD
jgi:hypothetical protein